MHNLKVETSFFSFIIKVLFVNHSSRQLMQCFKIIHLSKIYYKCLFVNILCLVWLDFNWLCFALAYLCYSLCSWGHVWLDVCNGQCSFHFPPLLFCTFVIIWTFKCNSSGGTFSMSYVLDFLLYFNKLLNLSMIFFLA